MQISKWKTFKKWCVIDWPKWKFPPDKSGPKAGPTWMIRNDQLGLSKIDSSARTKFSSYYKRRRKFTCKVRSDSGNYNFQGRVDFFNDCERDEFRNIRYEALDYP